MGEAAPDLNQRIAERVRELRAAQGLSLDALASKSGVMLASLFDAPAAAAQAPGGPVARRDDQPQWKDPASGYLRRNVSPPGVPQPMQIVEVHFPPGGRVACWAWSATDCAKVTAWPCSSTARRCSTTPHESPRAMPW